MEQSSSISDNKILGIIHVPFIPISIVRLINKNRSIILYGMIGGGAVVIDVGLFWLLDSFTGISVMANHTVSVAAAMIYSFLLNARFNFKTSDGLFLRFLSFSAVTGIGFLVSSIALWIAVGVIGIPSLIGKCLTLPLVFVVQFLLNSRLTFKNSTPDTNDVALESII